MAVLGEEVLHERWSICMNGRFGRDGGYIKLQNRHTGPPVLMLIRFKMVNMFNAVVSAPYF
jgi:hypothetical protein